MSILVIAPHADDEILGVGGTMAKKIAKGHKVYVCIVARGGEPIFKEEFINSVVEETLNAHKHLGVEETFFLDFPAVMLERVKRYEINNKILEIIREVKPCTVFIPHFGDMQKDHEVVAEAAMVSLRPKHEHVVEEIYAYETVSETEWNNPHVSNAFLPNAYSDISNYLDKKIEVISFLKSQLSDFPSPRSIENIKSLAKYRGSTVNVKAAEAFMLIRGIN